MFNWNCKKLQIGNLRIKTPIIQGGMGIGISLANLASAVANEGGVGVLSAAGMGMITKDACRNSMQSRINALREQIRKARAKTGGVLGVNIMVALSNFGDMVKTSIEEGIDIIFSGAGLPLNLPEFLKEGCKTKLVPIVSSGKAVKLITKWWKEKHRYVPDAFVVEGPLAGGHLGFKKEQIEDPEFRLEKLMEDVLQEVREIEKETG
ncbi:MAG: NAD(P)H-dependent flavin oxidoreductase, partial [Bacillota bacterium]